MSKIFDTDAPLHEMIGEMCEGNPGAAVVLGQVAGTAIDMAPFIMFVLDKHNIRGSNIWIAYKYYCKQNIGEFMMCCLKQCEDMISYVKNSPHYVSYEEQNKDEG